MRDLIVWMGGEGLFRARWTEQIHREWIGALLAKRPDLDPSKLETIKQRMNDWIPESVVSGYEHRIAALSLPDDKDRHVMAAAIESKSDLIVTYNLKDFPTEHLSPHGIEASHPDDFMLSQIELFGEEAMAAIRACRENMKKPAMSPLEYAEMLLRHELPQTSDELRRRLDQF